MGNTCSKFEVFSFGRSRDILRELKIYKKPQLLLRNPCDVTLLAVAFTVSDIVVFEL